MNYSYLVLLIVSESSLSQPVSLCPECLRSCLSRAVPPVPLNRLPLSITVSHFVFLSFSYSPVWLHGSVSVQAREKLWKREKRNTICMSVCVSPFLCLKKAPVLEMPHAEVANLHKGAFSKWAHYFSPASVCLSSNYYIYLLDIPFPSLTVCFFPRLLSFSPFSNLPRSALPPTLTHTFTYILTSSSIAIPERSRLVWRWAGLCSWTRWHPRFYCITPRWHCHSQVATLQWR